MISRLDQQEVNLSKQTLSAASTAVANTAAGREHKSHAHAAGVSSRTMTGGPGFDDQLRTLTRELHDCVMQDLWYLQVQLASLADHLPESHQELQPQVEELKQVSQTTYAELRKILGLLKSDLPSTSNLVGELETLQRKFGEKLGMRIELSASSRAREALLGKEIAYQARLVVQEALWNVWRHGQANLTKIAVKMMENGLAVKIADDGCGFDSGALDELGLGLANMRERAKLIKGRLYVSSRLGKGTQVVLFIPPDSLVTQTD